MEKHRSRDHSRKMMDSMKMRVLNCKIHFCTTLNFAESSTGNIGFDIPPGSPTGNQSNQDPKSRNNQPSSTVRSNSPSNKKPSGASAGASGFYGEFGEGSSSTPDVVSAKSSKNPADLAQSQKYCKWAISALEVKQKDFFRTR